MKITGETRVSSGVTAPSLGTLPEPCFSSQETKSVTQIEPSSDFENFDFSTFEGGDEGLGEFLLDAATWL